MAQYARGADGCFKIGRTSGPEDRWAAAYDDIYGEMVVIYQTNSRDHAADVEAALIDFFAEEADNLQDGSSGPWGEPPYYVYVVRLLDRSCRFFGARVPRNTPRQHCLVR